MSQTTTTTSAGIHWDLGPLFADATRRAPRFPRCSTTAARSASATAGASRELDAPELATALDELAALDNRLSRLASYAGLRLTVNVNGEAERDLNAAVEMALVEAQNALRFFQLEWIAVDDDARRARARRRAARA